MSRKQNNFDNDFEDVENVNDLLKEFELDLPDEDDAFFDIELESLEEYLGKVKKKPNKNGSN
jgi:hypothetical protein